MFEPSVRHLVLAAAAAAAVSAATAQERRGIAFTDGLAVARGGPAQGQRSPRLEIVATFPDRPMPTGLAVSAQGRIFLSFPRWGDPVAHTAVELRDGKPVPFPDAATNAFDPARPHDVRDHLVSVQSVVVDSADRLWLLDPGSIKLGPVLPGAPKLWGYDLATGRRFASITFPNDVVQKHTYLNDVRFDLRRGREGMAFLTDSGVGGIIVVDLATGESWRRLDSHPSVLPPPGFEARSEGEPFLLRKPNGEVAAPDIRSDGIELSPDGGTLYFTPLMSRDVFAVPTSILVDRRADEAAVGAAVRKIASKPSANDGLATDAQGRIYSTDWEDQCIRRLDPATGAIEVLAQDERMLWPDSAAMQGEWLYVVSNQLARQPNFHSGKDRREPSYVLFRLPVAGAAQSGSR